MAEEVEALESELQLRGRLMVDRDPSERRMDTLARLISGKSICVAVALINGKLYISANEFFEKTKIKQNKILSVIKETLDYLGEVSKGIDMLPDKKKRFLR